jgi:hypothetical protein
MIVGEWKRLENFGEKREAIYFYGGESILLKGAQATPARPSDKDRMRLKTLGWRVVQSCGRDGGILFFFNEC